METNPRAQFALTFLRVVLGITFIMHGVPKLVGGAAGTAEMFAGLGIPAPTLAAWFITILETFGGLALVLGAFVVPVSLLLAIHMATGILLVHWKMGFYVIGPGQGGMEFNLVLIASLLAMAFAGPGAYAFDARHRGGAIGAGGAFPTGGTSPAGGVPPTPGA